MLSSVQDGVWTKKTIHRHPWISVLMYDRVGSSWLLPYVEESLWSHVHCNPRAHPAPNLTRPSRIQCVVRGIYCCHHPVFLDKLQCVHQSALDITRMIDTNSPTQRPHGRSVDSAKSNKESLFNQILGL